MSIVQACSPLSRTACTGLVRSRIFTAESDCDSAIRMVSSSIRSPRLESGVASNQADVWLTGGGEARTVGPRSFACNLEHIHLVE